MDLATHIYPISCFRDRVIHDCRSRDGLTFEEGLSLDQYRELFGIIFPTLPPDRMVIIRKQSFGQDNKVTFKTPMDTICFSILMEYKPETMWTILEALLTFRFFRLEVDDALIHYARLHAMVSRSRIREISYSWWSSRHVIPTWVCQYNKFWRSAYWEDEYRSSYIPELWGAYKSHTSETTLKRLSQDAFRHVMSFLLTKPYF